MDHLRSKRWNDFQRRAQYAPHSVYRHRAGGWEYIPIHPFADEPDDLARLKMQPDECIGVDAWWGIEGDATLLEVWAEPVARQPAGLYARMTSDEVPRCSLTAVVDAQSVTRVAFESVMSRFAELGFPSALLFQLTTGTELVLPLYQRS